MLQLQYLLCDVFHFAYFLCPSDLFHQESGSARGPFFTKKRYRPIPSNATEGDNIDGTDNVVRLSVSEGGQNTLASLRNNDADQYCIVNFVTLS